MKRRWSLAAVIVSAACFGTLAVLTPLAYDSAPEPVSPLALLTWRFVIASALLAVVAGVRDRRSLAVPRSDVGRYALLALTGYGAASVCFFYALTFADASVVAVLLYAYPALVVLAGWLFLGEKASWQQAAAVVVTFLGCALVVGLGSGEGYAAWQGVVLGLGAAVGYTLFNLLSARWIPGRSRLTMMAYTFGIAALLPAAGALLGGGPSCAVDLGVDGQDMVATRRDRAGADVRRYRPVPRGDRGSWACSGGGRLDARALVHDRARRGVSRRAACTIAAGRSGSGAWWCGRRRDRSEDGRPAGADLGPGEQDREHPTLETPRPTESPNNVCG